jgi:hypothetical protein
MGGRRIMKCRVPIAVLVAAISGFAVPAAQAGVYRAAVCNDRFGANGGAAGQFRTTNHYVLNRDCSANADGLVVTHSAQQTNAGEFGRWRFTAAPGTSIEGLTYQASGRGAGGHRPQILLERPGNELVELPRARGDFKDRRWSGTDGLAVQVRLICAAANRCGRGEQAAVRARRFVLTLRDHVAPEVTPGGALVLPGSKRGALPFEPTATDVGGGVRRFILEVNGNPVNARDVECRLPQRVGVGVSPCPNRAGTAFGVQTAAAPFIQGVNRVQICVNDLAANSTPNTICRRRNVRADNACPVVGELGVARIDAQWEGKRGQTRTVRKGRGATLSGRVRGAAGQGLGGIPLCVGVRKNRPGKVERIETTDLLTRADGKFRYRVKPKRYAREARIANWPTEAGAFERLLKLKVRKGKKKR